MANRKKPDDKIRGSRLVVQMRKGEKEAVLRAADERDMTASQLVRDSVSSFIRSGAQTA